MTSNNSIVTRFVELSKDHLDYGQGLIEKFNYLFEVAKEDLSLVKLVEAHRDAENIIWETKRTFQHGCLYGVWASEIPGLTLTIKKNKHHYYLSGKKMFCSGAGIIDRALITAENNQFLIDLNLRQYYNSHIEMTNKPWATQAFQGINTATVVFHDVPFDESEIIAEDRWYLERQGFWKGALGPAVCWGGGAAALAEYGLTNRRKDPHTLAHLGAMQANVWAIKACIDKAAIDLDARNDHNVHAQQIALQSRHIIEQLSTDILRRFARAYGPFPIACDETISRRYLELDLFLRQNHAERDLENLGQTFVNM